MSVTRRSVLRSGAAVMASVAVGGGAAFAKTRPLAKDDAFQKYDAMGAGRAGPAAGGFADRIA